MTSRNDWDFRTKMWERSQSSFATTIPENVRAIRNVPEPSEDTEVYVVWTITEDGDLKVEFEEVEVESTEAGEDE